MKFGTFIEGLIIEIEIESFLFFCAFEVDQFLKECRPCLPHDVGLVAQLS